VTTTAGEVSGTVAIAARYNTRMAEKGDSSERQPIQFGLGVLLIAVAGLATALAFPRILLPAGLFALPLVGIGGGIYLGSARDRTEFALRLTLFAVLVFASGAMLVRAFAAVRW
jgi:hypothetical protein